jgi:hypothetical protein
MTTRKKPTQNGRVAQSGDKATHQARVNRAANVAQVAPTSAIWKAQPTLESAGNNLITLGTNLKAGLTAVSALESQLATARSNYGTLTLAYDVGYNAWVGSVEQYSTSPADVTGLGMLPLTLGEYVLEAPLGLTATYNPTTALINALVHRAPGLKQAVLQISTDPIGPATWKQLTGTGLRRALSGYAPGTYWLQAAHVRANTQSAWTAPVAVTVK